MTACRYCETDRSELRRRTLANGGIQYVDQCLKCGRATSTAQRASSICHPERLPEWDNDSERRYEDFRCQQYELKRSHEHQAFLAEHDIYLRTADWKAKRSAVLKRASGKCEGCGVADATQVHHLSYDHWKSEFLWELVAICDACHERAHLDKQEESKA